MAFTHILVPTDFSDPAHQALRYATEEAALHRARVTLLHVLAAHGGTDVYYVTGSPERSAQGRFDPIAGGRLGGPPPSQPTVVRRDLGDEALTQLNDLIPEAFRGAWQAETAAGNPADAIVRLAEERGVDLIVMGTHGRTGLQHVLLGSVAEKVVRLAPCPVLTVRHKGSA
jgi:nucleotide-binding universal stress UspA family protein